MSEYAPVVLTGAVYLANLGDYVFANATAQPITVTLPPPVSAATIRVKKTDTGPNIVTINTLSGLIDGAATFQILSPYQASIFVSDGNNWFVDGERILNNTGGADFTAGAFNGDFFVPAPTGGDDRANIVATAARIPDDGFVRRLIFPSRGNVWKLSAPVDLPAVLMTGVGLTTQIIATQSMSYMFKIRAPAAGGFFDNMMGIEGIRIDGGAAPYVIDYLVQIGDAIGVGTALDFIVNRCWMNRGLGDGLRIYAGKGVVKHSFFETLGATGLGLNYSQKVGGAFQGVSPIQATTVEDCFWQGCGQDLAAYAAYLILHDNFFGAGSSNPWNMFFDQCVAVDIHDNVWRNAMLAGNNLFPLISILDSTAGGNGAKDFGRAFRIHDNILNGFVNLPTYFISVDTPGGGFKPVPKYVYDNSGPLMGTAFVNTPAQFEQIENNDFDNLRGFGVATPGVPASTTAYTNITGHRLWFYILTATAATFTITDLRGNVSGAITAAPGDNFELLPNEIVTPTYTALTWKAYAT